MTRKLLCPSYKGYLLIVKALLRATGRDGTAVDLNVADKDGCTALICAARNCQVEVVTALLGAKGKGGVPCDLNMSDNNGDTALIWAAVKGNIKIVTALLGATGKGGVAVDLNLASKKAGKKGFTALILASYIGHTDIVAALLNAKEQNDRIATAVDVSMKDDAGHTAHYYATTKHAAKFNPEIVARLLTYGKRVSV